MSFAFVQYKFFQNSATPSATVTSPSVTLTAGNNVVVGLLGLNLATLSASTVIDTLGNNYTKVNSVHNGAMFGGVNVDLWYCENVIGGTGTITATFPYSSGFGIINFAEYSGLKTSGSLDASAVGTDNTAPSINITTVGPDDLIVGFMYTSTGGITTSTLTDRSGGLLSGFGIFGDQEQTPAGSPTITSDGGTSFIGALAAFKITPPTHSISGTVSGAIADGVTMTLSGDASGTTTTAGGGLYSFAGLADGSYTITPTKTGYTFAPTNSPQTVAGSNISGVNFVATQIVVATPTFSPIAGTYPSAQSVTVSDTDSGLAGFAMYYTTDGSTPTAGIYTKLAEDTFQRPDENPINPAVWTTGTVFEALSIQSHLCDSVDAIAHSGDGFAIYSAVSFPANQYGEITLAALENGAFAYIACRTNLLGQGYAVACSGPLGSPSGELTLLNDVTVLGDVVLTLNIGDKVRLECFGTNITVKVNGRQVISVTDSTTASGTVGVNISPFVLVTDSSISHFEAGSITTPASTLYSGPISVTSSKTIKVLAVATGFANSTIGSAAYVISGGGGGAGGKGLGFGFDFKF